MEIKLKLKSEELKKKLNIKNGIDGKDGGNGIDGIDGKDGYIPVKEKDYFDGKDGKNGIDGIDGKDGKDGKDGLKGIDGKDGSLDTGKDIVDKLSVLQDEDRLSFNVLKDIPYYKNKQVVINAQQTENLFSSKKVNGLGTFQDLRQVTGGEITRDVNGYISAIIKPTRTLNITRTSSYISSVSDGSYTWTFTRNSSNYITSWSVA